MDWVNYFYLFNGIAGELFEVPLMKKKGGELKSQIRPRALPVESGF